MTQAMPNRVAALKMRLGNAALLVVWMPRTPASGCVLCRLHSMQLPVQEASMHKPLPSTMCV